MPDVDVPRKSNRPTELEECNDLKEGNDLNDCNNLKESESDELAEYVTLLNSVSISRCQSADGKVCVTLFNAASSSLPQSVVGSSSLGACWILGANCS